MMNLQIPLDIPDVEIKSTKDFYICHQCGKEAKKIHGYGEVVILQHLSILGQKVFIRIRPARYECYYCDDKTTTTEQASWYNRRSRFTKAYEEYLMRMLINSTVRDVSRKEDVSFDAIEGVLNRQIERKVDWDSMDRLNLIGLDEISLKKGHKDFIAIISTIINGTIKILAILGDRKKETVKTFLTSIPGKLKSTVKIACCDMYDGYINAVKEVFGKQVKGVIDRFYVAKNDRKATDSLRKSELKRLKKELTEVEYKKLKCAMWALRKKENDLTDEEKNVLAILFNDSPILEQAYNFQNSLTGIFDQNIDKKAASKLIKQWVIKICNSELICFDKFISTLNNNWDDILNYFYRKGRKNSGFIEGLNNKVKVIKRRCYGIFNIGKLFQRIFLDLEGYAKFQ